MEEVKSYKKYKCLVAEQPIGEMYICVLDNVFLQKISTAVVRRKAEECRDVEEYVGIQRPLNSSREKEIGKYVNMVDATFPNSVIISISSEHVKYENGELFIEDMESIANVLDGQHRVAGLKYLENGKVFDCIVTIFIDIELEDQATIFSTINREQKKVSQSLVADLYEFYKTRNPQRTCHNIARALNSLEKSPLNGKISMLGSADNNKGESITQALFVKELMRHISKDPLQDRDILKRKDFWGNHGKLVCTEMDNQKTCLRKIFIKDENDVLIAQIIFNYFKAVEQKWPNSWKLVKDDNVLNKSTGFIALMRAFDSYYKKVNKEIPSSSDFLELFEKCQINDENFSKTDYILGTGGQQVLKAKLLEALK